MNKRKAAFLLVLGFIVFLGVYVFANTSNISKWCPTDICNGNHCWCDGDYIESLGPCCFTCWMLDPFNEWYVFACCGPGNCEDRRP